MGALIINGKIVSVYHATVTGVAIPEVSNVGLDEKGVLSWNEIDVDIDALNKYNPSVSYVVNVNGREFETYETSLKIYSYLENGANTVSVTAKIALETSKGIEIEFVKTVDIEVLVQTLPSAMLTSVAAVGTNVYMFGGHSDNGFSDEILKYDTLTETITTLSAKLPSARSEVNAVTVGTDIYLLGGSYNSSNPITEILKFDTLTETITTLEITCFGVYGASIAAVGTDIYTFGGKRLTDYKSIYKLDTVNQTYGQISTSVNQLTNSIAYSCAVAVGTDVYILGGVNYNNTTYYDTIDKYDTLTGKVTKLDITLPKAMAKASAVAIGDCIYIFGGFDGDGYFLNDIIKFDPINLTIETLGLTLPSPRNYTTAVAIDNEAYIFGGRYANNYLAEILKFTT